MTNNKFFIEKKSVLQRYANKLTEFDPLLIKKCSRNEGVIITPPFKISGVQLYFLDMTTLSETGTFKDWVACITLAYCLKNNIRRFVSQSSGNTVNSFSSYFYDSDIQVTTLFPTSNKYKINYSEKFRKNIRFIEVDGSEAMLKDITGKYAEKMRIPWLPNYSIQLEANKIRAYLLDEFMSASKIEFDWHAQAISSGYGILGFYHGINKIGNNKKLPRLLGIQQAAISPYFDYLSKIKPHTIKDKVIEPTLFRSKPSKTLFKGVENICNQSNGLITKINYLYYKEKEDFVIEILKDVGIKISRNKDGIIYEKSGILTIIGVLHAIEKKIVKPNDKVIVCITGGTSKGHTSDFQSQRIIKSFEEL